jgi:hypothetical protein
MAEKSKSRRYGKRFSSPYGKWSCGHRRNPTRKRGGRRHPAATIVKGKA